MTCSLFATRSSSFLSFGELLDVKEGNGKGGDNMASALCYLDVCMLLMT